ncbi:MAG TPA: heme-binding protein [Steroidobacteraceae bacterium]|jgi:hypothetical protein|nr:heme-binding protein [Steroidobacteraceae bacterium]
MKSLAILLSSGLLLTTSVIAIQAASADEDEVTTGCQKIYNAITTIRGATLYDKLGRAMTDGHALGKGLPLRQWGTIVDRDGIVCAVVTSGGPGGTDLNLQWLGSRVISAQKANTANAFSVTGLALSTANLYAATQPGGSLYGLQFSNPVSTAAAYGDNQNCHKVGCDDTDAPRYGQRDDPLVGRYVGGVNVFGGGLALYDSGGQLIGGLGTSGNTSCADHYISWVIRHNLGLDYVSKGVADGGADDNIIFDNTGATGTFVSMSGFGHPLCGIDLDEKNYPYELSHQYPVR